MKKSYRTITVIIAIMTLMYIITGCGKVNASASDMDTLSVMKDGSIVQTIVEQFEQNYYSVDELSSMTQEKIGLYNDQGQNIVCETIDENDGIVTVKMIYKTYDDYMDFNGNEMFFGTVEEASNAGYSLKDMLASDGVALSDEELEKIGNNHVLIIQTAAGEELGVNVYDKVMYMSNGLVSSGKKDVIIEAGGEDRLSCIVFK